MYKEGKFKVDDFERFRDECFAWNHEQNQKLIEEWCANAGVTEPVGFYNDSGKHKITIYTNKPGYLVGKGGCLINGFKQRLKEEFGCEYECIL